MRFRNRQSFHTVFLFSFREPTKSETFRGPPFSSWMGYITAHTQQYFSHLRLKFFIVESRVVNPFQSIQQSFLSHMKVIFWPFFTAKTRKSGYFEFLELHLHLSHSLGRNSTFVIFLFSDCSFDHFFYSLLFFLLSSNFSFFVGFQFLLHPKN